MSRPSLPESAPPRPKGGGRSYRLANLVPCLPELIREAMADPRGSLTVRIESGRVYTAGSRSIFTPEANNASLFIAVLFNAPWPPSPDSAA